MLGGPLFRDDPGLFRSLEFGGNARFFRDAPFLRQARLLGCPLLRGNASAFRRNPSVFNCALLGGDPSFFRGTLFGGDARFVCGATLGCHPRFFGGALFR